MDASPVEAAPNLDGPVLDAPCWSYDLNPDGLSKVLALVDALRIPPSARSAVSGLGTCLGFVAPPSGSSIATLSGSALDLILEVNLAPF